MEVAVISEKSIIGPEIPKCDAKTHVHEDDTEINVPVIKNIITSKYSLVGKLIWMAVILTCSIAMFINVVKRIQYYLSEPLTMNVRIERQKNMFYPDITICHDDFWRQAAYSEIQQEIGNVTGIEPSNVTVEDILGYMNIMDLWQRVAFRLEDIVAKCIVEKNLDCTAIGEWHTLISVAGICYTFSQSKPVNVSGNGYGITILLGNSQETATEREAWRVLLHDRHSTPKLSMVTEGFIVESHQRVNVKISLHKFRSVSTPTNPCGSISSADCKVNCLSDLTLQRTNCRLPFMEDVNVSYCVPPNHRVAEDLLRTVLFGKEQTCFCIPECNVNRYGVSIDSLYSPNALYARLYIFYENFFNLAVNEDFSYEFVALLADIGGTLGLFMGMSLLTIAELMEALIITLKRSARKHSVSKKPTVEGTIAGNEMYANTVDLTTHL